MYGAGGLVGRAACDALAARGMKVRALTRRDARVDDDAGLARAFAGCAAVICAAGPLRDTAEPVLRAAIAAGAHYLDVGGEQRVASALSEAHESTARKAGLVALTGCGVDGALGDLALRWAAELLVAAGSSPRPIGQRLGGGDGADRAEVAASGRDDGRRVQLARRPLARTAPPERLGEDAPFAEACTTYVYDRLALSGGAQRALFGAIGDRPLVWRRDRWEAAPGGRFASRRVDPGGDFGAREAHAFAGSEVIAVPRHIAADLVASYVSTTRDAFASTALGFLARAVPLLPRRASELFAPYAATPEACAQTRFAVVAQVRRGFATAQVIARGVDPYRTTGAIVALAAHALVTRTGGALGMRALAEIIDAEAGLHAIAGLVLEPSFAA